MLILNRIGNSVYFGDKKLVIVEQRTKGPGKEVVKIEGLEGSNGQKWISLKSLKEGRNEIETQSHVRTSTGSTGRDYELTDDERKQIEFHKNEINKIIEVAKSRYVKKPKILSMSEISKMSDLEKSQYMTILEAYVNSLKS